MNNITSITVVLQDGTVWSAEGSAFSQILMPTEPQVIEVPLDTPIEIHAEATPEAPVEAPVAEPVTETE